MALVALSSVTWHGRYESYVICDTHRLRVTRARGISLGVVARKLTIGPFGNAPHFSSPAGWGIPWTVPWATLEAGDVSSSLLLLLVGSHREMADCRTLRSSYKLPR